MPISNFLPGQRWISSAEPDAGLGIVVACQDRRVEISFPAIGEHRVYAIGSAPLSRVMFSEGDKVLRDDGIAVTIAQVNSIEGLLVYEGHDEEGNRQTLDELQLDSFVKFSRPQERLYTGQTDGLSKFIARRQTREHQQRLERSNVTGLMGARVQLLPHQVYIAAEVARRHAPRVMLADEVGLGKTIEAGLIVHQQLISGRAGRVLIVVPDTLVHQWLVEMLRRFNLAFTILDEERCQQLEFGGDAEMPDLDSDEPGPVPDWQNPFESAQWVICGLSFLVGSEERLEQARAAGWDLMVVDEAHHLRCEGGEASPEYASIASLATDVAGLLLLTATPEQLGQESHFARLQLLDPERYQDFESYLAQEDNYSSLRQLIDQLLEALDQNTLADNSELWQQLATYVDTATLDMFRAGIDAGDEKKQRAADSIIDLLLDRHGTGRVLFRNTRQAVEGFPERRLNLWPLDAPQRFELSQQTENIDALLYPELVLGEGWVATDPRVDWLADLLTGLRQAEGPAEKALVICARAETAKELENHLSLRKGCRSAVFHEGMSLIARDRAAAYFADEQESAQVLVCSEIGSEGRNFQFAHHLVLFDLPLNPDLLEQRIGRLDRIGQRNTVQLHVPFYRGSAQEKLCHWYHQGLNAFEQVCPVGGKVYDRFRQQLGEHLTVNDNPDVFDNLVGTTRKERDAAMAQLEAGRDRLLELGSCRRHRAEDLIAEIQESESPQVLADFMQDVFDIYGVEHSFHSTDALVLSAGDHMAGHYFPGLVNDGMTVTFRRAKALGREDMHFLSWEHPMVVGAMDMVLSSEMGNATVCTLKLPPLKPGTPLLETFYVLHCPAPKSLQLQRFLPTVTRRLLVDSTGKNLSSVIAAEHLDKLGQKIAQPTAERVARHARSEVSNMLGHCETLLAEETGSRSLKARLDDAIAQMKLSLDAERRRLEALAEINGTVRPEEIDFIRHQAETLEATMVKAEWRLDALRLVIAV